MLQDLFKVLKRERSGAGNSGLELFAVSKDTHETAGNSELLSRCSTSRLLQVRPFRDFAEHVVKFEHDGKPSTTFASFPLESTSGIHD